MPNPANIDDRNVSLGNYGISPNVTVVTEETTLKPHETNVHAITSNDGAYDIHLPNASECLNRFVRVLFLEKDTVNVTVKNPTVGGADAVLTDDEKYVLLFSDGRIWIEIKADK